MTDNTNIEAIDFLAQEIRRVDGNHTLGAGALAEALMPFIRRAALSNAEPIGEVDVMPGTEGFTMACFLANEVPIGTKLFLHPSVPAPLIEALKAARNIVSYAASGMTHSINMTNFANRILQQVDAALTNTEEQG